MFSSTLYSRFAPPVARNVKKLDAKGSRRVPDPPTRLVPSALAIMLLVTKNLATALGNAKKNKLCHFEIPFKFRGKKGDLIYKLSSFIH